MKTFRQELFRVLNSCNPKPETRFCIAIEEGEAWLLGDIPAIKKAYPKANVNVLNSYQNDSICDTWEHLADAVYPGGSKKLKKRGWQAVGKEKINMGRKNISKHGHGQKQISQFLLFSRKDSRTDLIICR